MDFLYEMTIVNETLILIKRSLFCSKYRENYFSLAVHLYRHIWCVLANEYFLRVVTNDVFHRNTETLLDKVNSPRCN